VATIGTEELGRYAGVGLTLDRVLEEELRKVGSVEVSEGPLEASDDVAIWERNKVVALVRIGPLGRPVVTRFDQPPAPAAGDARVRKALAAIAIVLAQPFPPKKMRPRRRTLSRRPSPRRRPGWGHP
jgi:hypothetical protein